MKPLSQCIFCGNTEDKVVFDKEHVIPQHLRGRLIFEGAVCKPCNGILGATVDHQLDFYHEVLQASQLLGLSRLYDNLIRHRHNVTAKLNDEVELRSHLINNKLVIHPQDTSTNTRFYPGDSFAIPLEKNLISRAKKLHLSENATSEECRRVIAQLHKATSFETVNATLLGTSLTKRDGYVKTMIHPKQKGNALPLVGKIAYEILYLVGGHHFFTTPNLRPRLVSIINGDGVKGSTVYRAKSRSLKPLDFHSIRLISLTPQSFPYVEITFFGCLVFICFLNTPLHADFWCQFKEQFSCPDAIGMAYHQGVKDIWEHFSVIYPDGTHTTLKK